MGGFNSVEGDPLGTIMYADNVSFDGTPRGDPVTADGELLIGATATPHIRVNTLTPGAGISITNGAGSITIATAGTALLQTTEDSGTAIPAAGNLNLLGQQAGTIPVMATNGTGSTARFEDRTWTTPFVVDASSTVGLRGTYTTISAALTDAVSGQTIYIRPGSYTENLTLKAGVNLVAYLGSEVTPTVTIIGTLTASFAGSCTISGIRLQTNAATFLTVSGSSATIITLEHCYLNATNNNGISMTSSSGSAEIMINYCRGNIGTTGIAMWTSSSSGAITSYFCRYSNSGGSTTQSTNSAGTVNFVFCDCNFAFASSGTANLGVFQSNIDVKSFNITPATYGGSGNSRAVNSGFFSGTASAISVSAGATLNAAGITVQSTNANMITGAGTLQYSGVSNAETGNSINVTTQTPYYVNHGKWRATGQPAFLATKGTAQNNSTGAGTVVTVSFTTEVFDQDGNYDATNTFTAPVTGKYQFNTSVRFSGIVAGMTIGQIRFVTSNRNYNSQVLDFSAVDTSGIFITTMSVLADMDAADTCTVTCDVGGGTDVVDLDVNAGQAYFSGNLLC